MSVYVYVYVIVCPCALCYVRAGVHEHMTIRGHVGMLLFAVYLVWGRLICSLQHVRLAGLVPGTPQSPPLILSQKHWDYRGVTRDWNLGLMLVEQSFYPPRWAISPVPKSCSLIYLQQVLFSNDSNLMDVCMYYVCMCVCICMCVCLYACMRASFWSCLWGSLASYDVVETDRYGNHNFTKKELGCVK